VKHVTKDRGGLDVLASRLSKSESDRFWLAMGGNPAKDPARQTIGDQLANLAIEVGEHADKGNVRRMLWGSVWKAGGALTAVVTAAVGGSILSINNLPNWGRYTIAGVAFFAAALGALQGAQELVSDQWRHTEYGSLYRQIVAYVQVTLPSTDLNSATDQLAAFEKRYVTIQHNVPNGATTQ
jgi:hypothetical protein